MRYLCDKCGFTDVWKNGRHDVKIKDFGDLDKSDEEKRVWIPRFRCKQCGGEAFPEKDRSYRKHKRISLRVEREILDLKFSGKMTLYNIQEHLEKHHRVHISIGVISEIINEAGSASAEVLKKLEMS